MTLYEFYGDVTGSRNTLIETVEEAMAYPPGSPYYALFRDWIAAYLADIETSTCQVMLLDHMDDALELHLYQHRTTEEGDSPKTQSEVAKQYRIDRSRVSQLKQKMSDLEV